MLSIQIPVLLTLMSLPILHRNIRFCPSKEELKLISTGINPFEFPDQACLPGNGLLNPVLKVLL